MNSKFALLSIALATIFGPRSHGQEPLFDVQVEKPSASKGDYVLCPSRQFYDSAVEKGIERTTFIYYAATMVQPGESESEVKNLAGSQFVLPNQFIISIPKSQTADVGDIVLTWWQSGSGMQRAIVVGGSQQQPIVRYLDITYENPSGAGIREEQLKPDSFYVLREPLQLGSTVAIDVGTQQRFGQLLAIDKTSVLIREFAGRLKQYDRSSVTAMPLNPNLKVGDAAEAALFGGLKPVTVKKVDEKIGRVFATYQLGRSEKEKAFAFGEIRSQR